MQADNENDNDELECRVCRFGAAPDRPLYTPCYCSGSIGLVHQDCLEQWLKHSRKDTCELCSKQYEFQPEYAENSPKFLSVPLFVTSVMKMIFLDYIPLALRVAWAAFLWLLVAPLNTNWMYRLWVRKKHSMLHMISDRVVLQNLKADIVEGLVLALVIALSFIVLVSFADFLRFHWINDNPAEGLGQQGRQRRRAGFANRVFLGAIPNLQPQAQEAFPENNNDNNNNNNNNDENHEVGVQPQPQQPAADDVSEDVLLTQPADENESINDESLEIIPHINYDSTAFQPRPTGSDADNGEEGAAYFRPDGELGLDNATFNEIVDHLNDAMLLNEGADDHNNGVDEDNAEAAEEAAEEEGAADEEDDLFNDPPGGEVEIRLALDDILGLRDPAHLLLRNVLWLIAFNGIFIGIFASIPCMIGQAVVLAVTYVSALNGVSAFYVPNFTFIDMLVEIDTISSASSSALHFSDIYYTCIGYSAISSVVFVLHLLSSLVKVYVTRNSLLNVFAEVMRSLASILKVGILLFIRIFTLPICLGTTLLYSFNIFFQYNREAWVRFITTRLVGAISLSWIIGISYMLTVTLSVLQLREVLHPDILAQAIRPQEPHLDLLSSLIHESYLTHVRRICASMIVYTVLLMMFVHVPMYISTRILNSTLQPIDFHVWYVLPELQLPAELAIAHIIFLTILDKKKNYIGKLQHQWMVYASEKMGLNRFIIPYRMAYIRKSSVNGAAVDVGSADDLTSRGFTVVTDANNVPVVGRPLRRPPPDWDARITQSLARWSWGAEEKTSLEKSIAPRVVPTFWLLRCVLLILLSWLVVILCVLFVFLVPVAIGRFIYDTLQLAPWGKHDPVLFLAGALVCTLVQTVLSSSQNRWLIMNSTLEAVGIYNGGFRLRIFWVMFQTIHIFLATVLSAGFMLQIFVIDRIFFSFDLADMQTAGFASLKGILFVVAGAALVSSRAVEALLVRWGLQNPFPGITNAVRRVQEADGNNGRPPTVEEQDLQRLVIIKSEILWPIFLSLVWRGALRVAMLTILFRQFLFYVPVVPLNAYDALNTPEGLLVFVRLTVLLVFSAKVYHLFKANTAILFDRLYERIRDDNYLIGRKLKNISDNRGS